VEIKLFWKGRINKMDMSFIDLLEAHIIEREKEARCLEENGV